VTDPVYELVVGRQDEFSVDFTPRGRGEQSLTVVILGLENDHARVPRQ
jgi:hypothetical protein